jgi:hypothetical protein
MADEDTTRRADPERQQLAREASRVVQQAASILQNELSAGSAAGAAMERKLATDRRVDPDEFGALAERVRKDVHDLISIAAELFTELQTDEVQGLAKRLATDAHDVVDTTMNVVDRTPQAANQLVRLGFMGPAPPGPPTADTTPEPGDPEVPRDQPETTEPGPPDTEPN